LNVEQHLNLTVSELVIQGKSEGYIFRFDTMTSDNPVLIQFLANRSSENSILTGHSKKSAVNSTIINNIPEQEVNMKIDKSFVPESQNVFILDAKKLSYVMNPKNPTEIKNAIKDEANKKLKKENTNNELESVLPSADEYSYSDKFENSGSEISSNNENNNMGLKQKKNEEYYQVSMESIKLLIYDIKKESLVEAQEQIKISQVELKKTEDYSNKEELHIKEIEITKKEIVETTDDDSIENNKEAVLIKQIEYALSKEENQPTIIRMKFFSFFIFIGIMSLATLFLYLFLDSVSLINENVVLIYNSYKLIVNTIYSIYHIRELNLLNNPKYFNIYQNREEYIKNNTGTLLELFLLSHDLFTSVTTTNMPISNANSEIMSNSTLKIYILEDNLVLKNLQLTLSASFLETNTALFHVANLDISKIYPTSKDVFFFLYNSMNGIYDMLFVHSRIYKEELTNNINGFKYNFLIIFIAACSFSFFSYFLITYAFLEVGKRKESYLEVFFEIGEGVIRNSLEKCEKFSKRFQSDNISEEVSNLDENEINFDPVFLTLGNGKSNKSSGSKKRKNNNSREDRITKFKIFFGLFFMSFFFFIIYIIYQNYLEKIQIYVLVFDNLAMEQAYYLMIFNILREYLFDRNMYIFKTPANEYILDSINEIYTIKRQRENVRIFKFPKIIKN